MTASAHYKAVADWIEGNVTLGDFTLKKRPPFDHDPDELVAVVETGGGNGRSLMVSSGDREKQPTVQIIVRAHKTNYDGGHEMARTLYDELQRADITGYATPWMAQDGPLHFQMDGDERHLFSVNIRLLIVE